MPFYPRDLSDREAEDIGLPAAGKYHSWAIVRPNTYELRPLVRWYRHPRPLDSSAGPPPDAASAPPTTVADA